ncbi:MAG: acetylornithine/succinylornithine family transaminase [Elusimicrobia bacterium]|nr:acetylornithine/succinylornithine family transaminase [Elusimicrobiota bacterium]
MTFRLPVYKQFKIDVDKAEGAYIYDTGGRKYVDFISGVSVLNMGHRPPEVMKAVESVMAKYLHVSNLYPEQNQKEYARLLVERTIPGKVFFSNSGAEANECAIKVARKYFDGDKYEIISFVNSFHGRTLATLGATGQAKFKEKLGPMPPEFIHAEFNFLASAEEKINNKTCAILVESIQAEGGVNVSNPEFMAGLRKLCDDNNILLILDEVQTGMGRTGKFLGIQHYGVEPDIVTMGKALGGGLPLGGTVIKDRYAQCMNPGSHGSTFGGNPVACAAGMATTQLITDEVLKAVSEKGGLLMGLLDNLKKNYQDIKEVRGKGLMVGMELDYEGAPLVDHLFGRGYLVNCTQDKVIRFLPPFIIEEHEINELAGAIEEFFQKRGEKNE